jgi:hypothetical protein
MLGVFTGAFALFEIAAGANIWYYNRIFHKGINAIPYEVFHAYDINRQNIVVHRYPIYRVGTVVIRKPIRMGGYVPIEIFDFEPEPFVINRVEGKLQGKYEIRSLVTGELERRWYKPYETRAIPKTMNKSFFISLFS